MTFNSLFYLYNNLGLGLLHRLNRIALSTKQLQNTWLTNQMARTNEEEGQRILEEAGIPFGHETSSSSFAS